MNSFITAFYNFFKPFKDWLFGAFHFDEFLGTLPVMGKGMVGIFIATAVMVAVMYLLSVCTKSKKD